MTDVLVSGLVHALNDKSYRIPEDISIICLGNKKRFRIG